MNISAKILSVPIKPSVTLSKPPEDPKTIAAIETWYTIQKHLDPHSLSPKLTSKSYGLYLKLLEVGKSIQDLIEYTLVEEVELNKFSLQHHLPPLTPKDVTFETALATHKTTFSDLTQRWVSESLTQLLFGILNAPHTVSPELLGECGQMPLRLENTDFDPVSTKLMGILCDALCGDIRHRLVDPASQWLTGNCERSPDG